MKINFGFVSICLSEGITPAKTITVKQISKLGERQDRLSHIRKTWLCCVCDKNWG